MTPGAQGHLAATTLALAALASPAAAERPAYTRNVAIVIWNDAEILDWTGPAEVFAAAGAQGRAGSEPAFRVYTVSKTREPIVSQGFIDVIPDFAIADAPKPDIVVFPGGGTGSVLNDPEFFEWAERSARGAEIAMSVCTGAFVLGRSGLLDGRSATTWYGALDRLEQEFPKTRVLRGPRYVDNGQTVTTAGVSAGIDGALHVVARLLGRHVAERTAQYMEYRWSPDAHLARNYTLLNPSLDPRGQRRQLAAIQAGEGNTESAIATCRTLLQENPDDAATWLLLGQACRQAELYPEATQAFANAARRQEYAQEAWYNAACSTARAGNKPEALEFLRNSIAAGFNNPEALRREDDFAPLQEDPGFQALLHQLASNPPR